MPNDLARGRNVTAEIKKSSSGDSSVGWLDEDFLRSLGADSSDARFSPWLQSKQPKQLLFSRVAPGTQDPQEVWLQLERDLNGMETQWKDRLMRTAKILDPRGDYQLHCSQQQVGPQRDPDSKEMRCCEFQLGAGAFGCVHSALCQTSQVPVAIKALSLKHIPSDQRVYEHLSREVFCGFNIDHPCLVKMHDVFLWDEHLHLVMELVQSCHPKCRCPDLFSYLTVVNDHKPLSPNETALVVAQAGSALNHLNVELGAIHRDIKPENILVGRAGLRDVKLCDYGAIRLFHKKSSLRRHLTSNVGTEKYMATEVRGRSYSENVDVYSLGCVFHVCAKVELFVQGQSSVFVPGYPAAACQLLSRMVRYMPQERLSMPDVLQNEWLTQEVAQCPEVAQKLKYNGKATQQGLSNSLLEA